MTKKEKDDLFAARIPGILKYHQQMLADGVRNELLYKAIKTSVSAETNFLDIGAGAGAWAILAAKLGAKRVVAVEIEECLIPIIHRHAKENGVAQRVEIIHGNADDVRMRGKFDVIVSELFGDDAFSETTVNSFINLRKRFLAPGGTLIPQKLTTFAVPARIESSVHEIPANLPLNSDFLKSLQLNYPNNLSLSERPRVKFLAEPQQILEVDFRTIEKAPLLKNLSAEWQLENVSEANAFAVYNHSTFADEIKMDAFDSQSWGTNVYEFQPYEIANGAIKFSLTRDEQQGKTWSISVPSHPQTGVQNYSPVFAFTRLRMAQQMTPHRKFNQPKAQAKSKKTRKK